MAKGLITQQHLEDIAEAIRGRNNSITEYKPSEMAAAVAAIPNSYTAGDEGKVVSNGALVAQTARASAITENGTFDTTENNSVTVNVSGGGTEDWLNLKNYIESSGTQYIRTEYTPINTTKFEVIADVPDNTNRFPCLIGERQAASNEVVIYTEFNGGNLGLVWANGDYAATSDDVRQYYIGNKCKYVLGGDGLRGVLNANGYGFVFMKAVGTFATLPIFIFVLNENGTPNSVTYCSAKLYRFRIYEGNTLVHEFIPWQENGVACLKDTVTGNFLYNAGTGDLVYGTDA